AGAVGNAERLPLAPPAPRPQLRDGGLQVRHGEDRHAAGGGPVVGQQDQRPRAEPERGDLGTEGVEGPDPLGPQHLRVVAAVAVEVRRPDVEVLDTAERWGHRLASGSAGRPGEWGGPPGGGWHLTRRPTGGPLSVGG